MFSLVDEFQTVTVLFIAMIIGIAITGAVTAYLSRKR